MSYCEVVCPLVEQAGGYEARTCACDIPKTRFAFIVVSFGQCHKDGACLPRQALAEKASNEKNEERFAATC